MTLDFKEEGDIIYLLGEANNDINCSEYLHNICNIKYSPAPYFDLEAEYERGICRDEVCMNKEKEKSNSNIILLKIKFFSDRISSRYC